MVRHVRELAFRTQSVGGSRRVFARRVAREFDHHQRGRHGSRVRGFRTTGRGLDVRADECVARSRRRRRHGTPLVHAWCRRDPALDVGPGGTLRSLWTVRQSVSAGSGSRSRSGQPDAGGRGLLPVADPRLPCHLRASQTLRAGHRRRHAFNRCRRSDGERALARAGGGLEPPDGGRGRVPGTVDLLRSTSG